MRLNVFKNIRLSLQLYALVAITLAIATGLIFYAMQQVRSTQGTLKHTIDNRMVSGQSIQGVADALSLSLEASLDVIEKKQTAIDAHDQLKKAIDKARERLGQLFPRRDDRGRAGARRRDHADARRGVQQDRPAAQETRDQRPGGPAVVAQRDAATGAGRRLEQSEEADRHAADRGQPRPRQRQQELPAGGAQQHRADVGAAHCWPCSWRGSSSAAPCASSARIPAWPRRWRDASRPATSQFEMEAAPSRRHQPHGRAAPDEGQPAALQAGLPGADQRDRQSAGRHRVLAGRRGRQRERHLPESARLLAR